MIQSLDDALKAGHWLNRDRLRAYAWIMLAVGCISFLGYLGLSNGKIASDGQPIGTDFSNVWAAGRMALDGHAASAYDWTLHGAVERGEFGADTPYYGWHYPPIFLAIAALLALLPYIPALIVWQAATFPLYLMAMRAIAGGRPHWLVAACAFPAVFINLGHGHNGFLTAGLFGGGLVLLKGRPVVAGLLLGALCYKPQFGMLVPLALAAGGHWRSFAAAGAMVAALCLASAVLFGPSTWAAFHDSLALTRTVVLEEGSTGWYKIQTVFSALRNWGADIALAWACQGAVTLAAAACVVLVWRSRADDADKAATLLVASLLATPYSLDYDLMALAPALAFMAVRGLRSGFLPYERTILVAAYAMPLLARAVMKATTLPLGVLVLGAVFAVAIRSAFLATREAGSIGIRNVTA